MDYSNIRKTGVIAIVIDEGDELRAVSRTSGDDSIILSSFKGKSIKFSENDVRPMGRVTRGVRGIKLEEDDYLVSMAVADEDATLLSITEKGYGKRTRVSDYRTQARGGKGVTNYNISEKTGNIASAMIVDDNCDIMIVVSNGVVMRTPASEISVLRKATQGVRVVKLADGVTVIDTAVTEKEDEQPEAAESEE